MELRLIVQNGKQAGRVIPIGTPRFLIGRADECQLRVQSNLISRRHTLLIVDEDAASVEDCGSTNGTFLNDERVTSRRELQNGDCLKVGVLTFDVQLGPRLHAPKRPKVNSVQEAAARTAAAPPPAKEEFDISGWIGENGLDELPPSRKSEATHETVAEHSVLETTTIPAAQPKPEVSKQPLKKDGKSSGPAKVASKFQVPPKKMAESSGAAADDALRQFFHRKKP
ncbi:MAG: FHA domain-containing protein [Planctomycetaceae bacterium]|nr:FHA domain-containing protein [Planctomycetaceae bacterium]